MNRLLLASLIILGLFSSAHALPNEPVTCQGKLSKAPDGYIITDIGHGSDFTCKFVPGKEINKVLTACNVGDICDVQAIGTPTRSEDGTLKDMVIETVLTVYLQSRAKATDDTPVCLPDTSNAPCHIPGAPKVYVIVFQFVRGSGPFVRQYLYIPDDKGVLQFPTEAACLAFMETDSTFEQVVAILNKRANDQGWNALHSPMCSVKSELIGHGNH